MPQSTQPRWLRDAERDADIVSDTTDAANDGQAVIAALCDEWHAATAAITARKAARKAAILAPPIVLSHAEIAALTEVCAVFAAATAAIQARQEAAQANAARHAHAATLTRSARTME